VTEDRVQDLLRSKSEVIHLLFWYTVRQGQCRDFDAILRLAKRGFDGLSSHEHPLRLSALEMCTHASPWAVVLAGPYIDWEQERPVDAQDLISKWMVAISVAPRTEEVAGSVVDTLLQIAANRDLRPSIPADAWLWLNERPPLPPSRRDLLSGSDGDIFRTIRALDDIGVLTSYLIMIWSEWERLNSDGFTEMRMSVREDFNGGQHQAELIQRLDSVLGELDRRSGHLDDDKLWHDKLGHCLDDMTDEYGELKRILQEVDEEATEILSCMSSSFIFPGPLTLMDLHRTPLHLHVRPASSVSMTSRLERSAVYETNRFVCSRSTSLLFLQARPGSAPAQFHRPRRTQDHPNGTNSGTAQELIPNKQTWYTQS
jgi:hypothetical protein